MKKQSQEDYALKLTDLSAGYNTGLILSGLNLNVDKGERVALIGPNGSGKSTLLKTIVGDIYYHGGAVNLNGQDLSAYSISQRVDVGISYLRQGCNVFGNLTVKENLYLAARATNTPQTAQSRIHFLLQSFDDLKPILSKRAGLLSGGQKQMLAVAMTLCRKVKLLLLDEPIAGLMPATAEKILRIVGDVQSNEGFTVIVIEHRLRLITKLVSRVVVMREGHIVADTRSPSNMLDTSWLSQHYAKALG